MQLKYSLARTNWLIFYLKVTSLDDATRPRLITLIKMARTTLITKLFKAAN